MKYAGSVALTFLLMPLANADISSRVYGGLNIAYQKAKTDNGTSVDIGSIGARIYPGSYKIKAGQPKFEIDQINGASYLELDAEESDSVLDGVESKQTTNTLGGRLVLANRELFIGAKLKERAPESENPNFEMDVGRETEVSIGLRRGRLLSRYANATYSSESSLYLGGRSDSFRFIQEDFYAVSDRKVDSHNLSFSWVGRTENKHIFVIQSSFYQRNTNTNYRIQEYTRSTFPGADEDNQPDPFLSDETELEKDVMSYLGAGVSVTYYPSPDVLLNAGWFRFPEESPRVSVNSAVVLKDRFVISALASAGREAYRTALGAGVRF